MSAIMIPEPNVNFYAAWEPVRINAGSGASNKKGINGGFWLNSTGLQWTADVKSKPNAGDNLFGGWIGKFVSFVFAACIEPDEENMLTLGWCSV
jgi:hypothetical protein